MISDTAFKIVTSAKSTFCAAYRLHKGAFIDSTIFSVVYLICLFVTPALDSVLASF